MLSLNNCIQRVQKHRGRISPGTHTLGLRISMQVIKFYAVLLDLSSFMLRTTARNSRRGANKFIGKFYSHHRSERIEHNK